MIKKNIKNISLQSAAQLVPKAMMFVFVMYLAKTLGAIEYGKYEFALSVGYIIGIFFELGGNMILTKHVARDFYSSIYYALKIRIYGILITLTVFIAVLFLFGLYSEIRIYIIYACLGVAFSSLMNLYFAFFRGARDMKYEAAVLVIQKVIFIVTALALMINTAAGSAVLLSFMLSMIAGLVIIYVIFKRKESGYLSKETTAVIHFKQYIKDVFSLAMVEIFASIYFRLNQIFIEHFRGFDEVSIYGVAYRIIEVFTNIPSILLLALFPSFAKLASENMNEFRISFNKVLKYLAALGIAAAAFCWFAGELLLGFLGNDYKNSYIVLRYLCFPLLFLFPNYLITQGLIALNKNILFAKILFSALIINIVISIVLVPQLGAAGSAVSIGICEAFIFISGLFFIRKYTAEK